MGCGQCSSGSCGSTKVLAGDSESNQVGGCGSSGGCSSGGCTKLNSFDWLTHMNISTANQFNAVEVKFKGGRKDYYINGNHIELNTGDFVVCQMATGYHIGVVSLQGELVRLQLAKRGIKNHKELPKIQRLANERDMEKHEQAINRDLPTMFRTRELIREQKLPMKLSDVEYQSDNSKATFFYSAEDRVDFRELIKRLAGEFRIRVEMRQISLRQEAARIGGIGSCGRELCCSTWLTDFKSIPTAAARYQNLSLNPAKLSGQCGRLKCCLNYELDTYLDALQGIPEVKKPLFTERGEAFLQKTDIFRRLMWFSYKADTNWYSIACSQVMEIQEMNKKGVKPLSIENLSLFIEPDNNKGSVNSELDRLDKKFASNNGGKKRRNKNRKPNRNNRKGKRPQNDKK